MRGQIPEVALHDSYRAEDLMAEARDLLVLINMAMGDGDPLDAEQVTAVMLANLWALDLVRRAEERLNADQRQRAACDRVVPRNAG
ncbi:hypothetical protein RUR49_06775 [Pseudoxanthobacter sp. M-2]|uniref:hypothetical protein n=1 Tax=Pseudoxanthobacter sp. M-2 TaxID=3078754 RepID=UPI0038FC8385